jgi:hypothetical protein
MRMVAAIAVAWCFGLAGCGYDPVPGLPSHPVRVIYTPADSRPADFTINACARTYAPQHLRLVSSSDSPKTMTPSEEGPYVAVVLAEAFRDHWLYIIDVSLCALNPAAPPRVTQGVGAASYGGIVTLKDVRQTPEGPILLYSLDRAGILRPQ